MSTDRSDALAPFSSAMAASVEHALSRRAPVPDIEDTLARAEAMAPRRVPAGMRAALAELEHVVPLARGRERTGSDAELDPFAAALRAHVEDELHARGLAPIPPAPTAARRWPLVMGAIAAAAAAIVAFAMLGGTELLREDDHQAAAQAERTHDGVVAPGAARVHEDAGGQAIEVGPRPDARVPAPLSPPAVAEEPPTTDARAGGPAARKDSLQALAAAAEAAWKRGELGEAERIYRRIVALGGRGRQADLAYGDLFAIARQLGGADDQAALWREYLRRFPRGRFAEDARAGLCRRASGPARARCWDDYLRAHPRGTHADEARRARGEAPK